MRRTPLPEKLTRHRLAQNDHPSLAALALARFRDDVVGLIDAVDRGEVPADLVGAEGKPALALALEDWWRLDGSPEWGDPPAQQFARFVSGQPWDGTGLCKPSEHLAAALFSSGVELFPEGADPLVNLEAAVRNGALATSLSLLHAPACPDLKGVPGTGELLAMALEKQQSALVRALLAKGAEPNALSERNNRPAWFSARTPQHLVWLIEAGADVSLLDHAGRSAPVVWSLEKRVDAKALGEMGKVLSGVDPDQAQDSHVSAAFAAVGTMRVGSTKSWLSQDSSFFSHRMPVPGMPEDSETLTQKMVRLFVEDYNFSKQARLKQAYGIKPPPMGMLKLFMEHPATPHEDRLLVALVATAMGKALGPRDKAAARVWASMEPQARELLSEHEQLGVAWEGLGHVFRRLADGATLRWYSGPGRGGKDRASKVATLAASMLESLSPSNRAAGGVAWPPAVARCLIPVGPFLAKTSNPSVGHAVLGSLRPHHKQWPRPEKKDYEQWKEILLSDPRYGVGALVGLVLTGKDAKVDEEFQALKAAFSFLQTSALGGVGQQVLDAAVEAHGPWPLMEDLSSQWRLRGLNRSLPSAPSTPTRPRARM